MHDEEIQAPFRRWGFAEALPLEVRELVLSRGIPCNGERLSNRVGQIQSNVRCGIADDVEIETLCFGLRFGSGESGAQAERSD